YSPQCREEIHKLCRKNAPLEEAFRKKVAQILGNPFHFKPLHAPMQNKRRVHVLGCFVLTYEVVGQAVRLLHFSHHDQAY
ncbi:MAG: type II toxin-antitoxin system RelE/ParE family toxin, partial [Candidatus Micrarchaeota archaeon]